MGSTWRTSTRVWRKSGSGSEALRDHHQGAARCRRAAFSLRAADSRVACCRRDALLTSAIRLILFVSADIFRVGRYFFGVTVMTLRKLHEAELGRSMRRI